MRRQDLVFLAACIACGHALLVPATADAPSGVSGVHASFDLDDPERCPFPSDWFTVPDDTQLTGRRIALPKPDCATHPNDCADIDVLNTLDGFNRLTRISIPFDGQIDPASAAREGGGVLLIRLGDGAPVGVNQVIFDPATETLHVEVDELLEQHTRYAVIVTDRLQDLDGNPVGASEEFARFRHDLNFGRTKSHEAKAYRKALLEAIDAAPVPAERIVAASVFTTISSTAGLEAMRAVLHGTAEPEATFEIGTGGERAVFPFSQIAGISNATDRGTQPALVAPVPLSQFGGAGSAIATVAYGRFSSPEFRTPLRVIPPFGTRTGAPEVQGSNVLYFDLYLPAGSGPFPIVIYGPGASVPKEVTAGAVANKLAAHGLATIAMNPVANGGGPNGKLTVTRKSGFGAPVTFSNGGRSIDADGNGIITAGEGDRAAGIVNQRDRVRQAAVDCMQLVRLIQSGIDLDGDGASELDASRITYYGLSFGGAYGTALVAIEPAVRAAVLDQPIAWNTEGFRTGPNRSGFGTNGLGARVPPLAPTVPGITIVDGIPQSAPFWDENIPARDVAPVENAVAGAMEIQTFLEHFEWVHATEEGAALGPYIERTPLPGNTPKPVLVQVALGDRSVTIRNTMGLVRSAGLEDRIGIFRTDRALAADPSIVFAGGGVTGNRDPHGFATRTGNAGLGGYALQAQEQAARFCASLGTDVIDPDGAAEFFELPMPAAIGEQIIFVK